MIQEDYVSFEVAKLLREKGFDGSCYQKYDDEGYLSFNSIGYINSDKLCYDFYALAPTLQTAMKWLREVHHLHITIFSSSQESWMYRITKPHQTLEEGCYGEDYISFEEACEAAIKYCLNNLI